jgi:hypothetical protein
MTADKTTLDLAKEARWLLKAGETTKAYTVVCKIIVELGGKLSEQRNGK